VIMLTARARTRQGQRAGRRGGRLHHKPFSSRELLARIQAVLRRAAPAAPRTPSKSRGSGWMIPARVSGQP